MAFSGFCKGIVMIKSSNFISFLLLLLVTSAPAFGEEPLDELLSLGSATGSEQQTVTTTRTPIPISRIAENVTVVTAGQIALLNAHTLNDVLQTVAGIQLNSVRTPGSWTAFSLNTLDFNHVLVFIDGVSQNDIINNFPETGLMPAQQIERIEIIKGPASASWGAAMGGVVNVVTKSGEPDKRFGGTTFASAGERTTTDLNADIGGTVDRLGYYVAGGNLSSRGLLPGNDMNFNHAWFKLSYDLPAGSRLTAGANIREALRGLEESAPLNYRDTDRFQYSHLFIDYQHNLTDTLKLDLSGRFRHIWDRTIWGSLVPDPTLPDYVMTQRQNTTAASAKLGWDNKQFSLLAGCDYEHHDTTDPNGTNRLIDRWAAYLNGSATSGPLTILPGIRYDYTGLETKPVSLMLGATYQLTDKTLIRGYTASGYGLSLITQANSTQKIRTIQLGMESTDAPYLWLKSTLFYNRLTNMDASNPLTPPLTKQIRKGIDLEARSVPIMGFTFSGGYTWAKSRDDNSHYIVKNVESQSLKAAIIYRSEKTGLSGSMNGNYVWWNSDSSGHYTPMVWDLHLTQKLPAAKGIDSELFFSGYNLFNGSQYLMDLYRNTRRWLEGGVRFRF